MEFSSHQLRGLKVVLTEEVAKALCGHFQKRSDRESGGMLFGTFKNGLVEIQSISEPNFFDRRAKTRFVLHKGKANKTIERFHKKGLHYLGDWHTHSEESPNPSREDINTIRSTFNESSHQLRFFIIMILSNKSLDNSYLSLTNGHREFLFNVTQ
ncbi:Mov34/MPN/PAD-1 family protein [Vibrio vulnificus]|nr:Mov34/MPN/PAD-1 family protein [Vibrio vulnificus]